MAVSGSTPPGRQLQATGKMCWTSPGSGIGCQFLPPSWVAKIQPS
jgi:hypothetical protein